MGALKAVKSDHPTVIFMHNLDSLLEIMALLRHPTKGCPWDLAQTYETIAPHTVEEAYEVADAIEQKDFENLKDELGDLLFQIIFYCQLSNEKCGFGFTDVVDAICDKMIRRHPNIFRKNSPQHGEGSSNDLSWEAIKAQERIDKNRNSTQVREISVLDDIVWSLPSLSIAIKLQRRASVIGFDWSEITPVIKKIAEELHELEIEINSKVSQEKIEEEMGDLLFACSNLARHLDLNPEMALRKANRKFERRFRKVENLTKKSEGEPTTNILDKMQAYWEQVKLEEKD